MTAAETTAISAELPPRPLHHTADLAGDIVRRLEVVELALDGLAEATRADGIAGLRAIIVELINDTGCVREDLERLHAAQRNDPMLDEIEALDARHGQERAAIFERHRSRAEPHLAEVIDEMRKAIDQQREMGVVLAQLIEQRQATLAS